MRKFGNEVHAGVLRRREAWHERAEVDACGDAEGGGDVLGELLGRKHTVGVVGDFRPGFTHLCEADLRTESVYVLAELDVVHTVFLEGFQAGDLGDQIHDPVLTAHELTEAKGGVGGGEMFFAVGVCESWSAALDGGAEDIDPGCECHVEELEIVGFRDQAVELEFLYQRDGGLEMLVPWDVWERVVETTD